jgi:hypothetical protein
LRLPTLASEAWKGGFVTGGDLGGACAVDARHGVVFAAAADRLVLLRAGETAMAAVEPRRRPRLAVAAERGIAVLDDGRVATLSAPPGASMPERLAWGKHPAGGFALYVLHEDGSLLRVRVESGDVETLPFDCVVAVASDEGGAVAIASIDPAAPGVRLTRDGERWEWRPLSELDGAGGWELAVAGDAAALAIAHRGVWLSRGAGAPFARCEPLGAAGALAFGGESADAALFGAVHEGFTETLVRVDAAGRAARIAEIGGDDREPFITALAWDASRRTLWGVLPGVGLLKSEAPRGVEGGAGTLLS